MFRMRETVRIDRPPAEVWAMLTDFPNVPAWEAGVLEVRQTSPGRPGLGTTFVARRVYGRRVSTVDCRIVDWQDDRSATMEVVGGPMGRATTCYAVEPVGDHGTRVTFSAEGELPLFMVWLKPFIALMGRRLIRSNLATLARLLDEAASRPNAVDGDAEST